MENILNLAQITLAGILIVAILLQKRGMGMGSVLGGGGGEGNVYRTKRGFEKTLFTSTIVLSILFFGVALANVLIQQ